MQRIDTKTLLGLKVGSMEVTFMWTKDLQALVRENQRLLEQNAELLLKNKELKKSQFIAENATFYTYA